MSTDNSSNDVLNFAEENTNKLPQGLNVLTILTFIGCAFALLVTVATPYLMKFSMKMMDKAAEMGSEMSDAQLADIMKAKHLMELTQQNIVPLMISGLIGTAACFLGALWMRKLKKDGYWIYIAGQILPLVGGFIFLGTAQYADWKSYFGLIVPAVFIVLYTIQKKHLTK